MSIKNQLTIISTLTRAEMKGRYRNTFAGVLWVMFNPLLLFAVHALIFKFILKINVDRYFVFLLSGLLPWIYISTTLQQTVNSFITMRESLLSFQIHPLSIIVSKSIDNFINFIIPFFFLFALLFPKESFDWVGIAMLPVAFLILLIGTTALAIIVANIQVFFRDMQYITNFIINIMFFLTPIFYPRHLIPERFQFFVDMNPFYAYIRTFKTSLWNYSLPDLLQSLSNASIFVIITVTIAATVWKKTRHELYLNI